MKLLCGRGHNAVSTICSHASSRGVYALRNDYLHFRADTSLMKDDDHPRNHLKAWREYRRMTQQALADAIGSSKAVIGLLENGDRRLSDKWAAKIAPALGTRPGLLFDTDPHEVDTDILEIWASIPENKKSDLRTMLRSVATGTNG